MGNLFNLTGFRLRRYQPKKRHLFYIHQKKKIASSLEIIDFLKVTRIDSFVEFSSQLHFQKPEMVFLEADITWAHPLQIIDELNRHLNCPIVLVCDRKRSQKSLIKQACNAGIFDVLFTPLLNEELLETLRVLLKLPALKLWNR